MDEDEELEGGNVRIVVDNNNDDSASRKDSSDSSHSQSSSSSSDHIFWQNYLEKVKIQSYTLKILGD